MLRCVVYRDYHKNKGKLTDDIPQDAVVAEIFANTTTPRLADIKQLLEYTARQYAADNGRRIVMSEKDLAQLDIEVAEDATPMERVRHLLNHPSLTFCGCGYHIEASPAPQAVKPPMP